VKYALILLAATFALTSACSKSDTSSATSPTTVTRTTDTFTGTVQVHSVDTHTFAVTNAGETDVTLTATTPNTTIVMGLSIGLVDASSNCVPIQGATTLTAAGTTAQLGLTSSPGNLCVQVRDVGNQTTPIGYTVTVLHP
jgi:hypothetical protein